MTVSILYENPTYIQRFKHKFHELSTTFILQSIYENIYALKYDHASKYNHATANASMHKFVMQYSKSLTA